MQSNQKVRYSRTMMDKLKDTVSRTFWFLAGVTAYVLKVEVMPDNETLPTNAELTARREKMMRELEDDIRHGRDTF